MSETKRFLKVFLCHAHDDCDPARELHTRLIHDGVDAWLDKVNLFPGQNWEMEIRKAVRESDVVLICISKSFDRPGFRQKEMRLAIDTAMEQPEGEIFIIPARLEECDVPENLKKYHWVDLFEEEGYPKLLEALRLRADRVHAYLQKDESQPVQPLKINLPPAKPQTAETPARSRLSPAIVFAVLGSLLALGVTLLVIFSSIGYFVGSNTTSSTFFPLSFIFENKNIPVSSPLPVNVPQVSPTSFEGGVKPTVTSNVEKKQTPEAEAWSNPVSVRMPTLNEIRADMLSIWDANDLSMGDITSPGLRSFNGTARVGKEYLWPVFWCALDKETLDQNIAGMTTVFTVNEEQVSDEFIFNYYYDTDNGWKCNYQATVIGDFPKNTAVSLQVTRTVRSEISDGQISYPAGDYSYQLIVTAK